MIHFFDLVSCVHNEKNFQSWSHLDYIHYPYNTLALIRLPTCYANFK